MRSIFVKTVPIKASVQVDAQSKSGSTFVCRVSCQGVSKLPFLQESLGQNMGTALPRASDMISTHGWRHQLRLLPSVLSEVYLSGRVDCYVMWRGKI